MKFRKIKVNYKIIIPIFLFILFVLIFIYGRIINIYLKNSKFLQDAILISDKNREEVFSLEKIILTSSANVVDNSENKTLQDLNIYQFTDIAIFIDNGENLTNKNTVKKLTIDNISINTKSQKGIQSLNYENFMNFGKPKILKNETPQEIDFDIIYTNEENSNANYDEPTFYTDCSNPLTLGYLNNDIVTGYKIEENTSVSFNGKILKAANVELKDIESNIKFKVNIENNMQEKYSCWLNFDLPLGDIFNGVSLKAKELKGEKYIFFCEIP